MIALPSLRPGTFHRWLLVLAGVVLTALPAVAAAQAVAQSYTAGQGVQQGMIVELANRTPPTVVPLTIEDARDLLGVVVPANDSSVALSNGSTNQVYVATTGTYNVLVSTQNGAIKTGDYITISSLAGIGAKADGSVPVVLGKALAGFDGSKNVSGTTSLSTSRGSTPVAIGVIPVALSVAHNPLNVQQLSGVPGFLQRAGQTVADKPISPLRLYISLVVLGLTIIVVGIFLYGGIRSSMISIGRNPLARHAIVRGMLQVVMVGLIIFVIGLFAVYLILKL